MALVPIDQKPDPQSDIRSMIADKAEEHGIDPGLMLALAHTESGFNPKAISPTGATGLFQFTRGTAKQYGLKNRLDPVASADAAARYLSVLKTQTNGDTAEMVRRYKGVRAGGASEADVNTTLALAKNKYGADIPDAGSENVPKTPAPSLPDLVNMSDDDFNAWVANVTRPQSARPAPPPLPPEEPEAAQAPPATDLFKGVKSTVDTESGALLNRQARAAIPYVIPMAKPKTFEASGEGVVGQPLLNAKPTGIPVASGEEAPTLQAGTGTSFGTEAGRVLMAIAQGPIKAVEKITGAPTDVDAQTQIARLNPDIPKEAAEIARLKEGIRKSAAVETQARNIGGEAAVRDLQATGLEPQTGLGQTIANVGSGTTEFLTEAALAKGLSIPEITGLNTFGSAALVGVARPVIAGEETPFQAATEIGGGELLGNALKIPNVVPRVATGAAITGGQAALEAAASGKPLDMGVVGQAALGAFMTLGGEHEPAEPIRGTELPSGRVATAGELPAGPTPEFNMPPSSEPVTQPKLGAAPETKGLPQSGVPRVGEEVHVAAGKIPVTIEAPKGSALEMERGYVAPQTVPEVRVSSAEGTRTVSRIEPEKVAPAESRTLTHSIGSIETIGQTKDSPMTTLVGDDRVGKKVFVADLYEDGKFAGHNVIAQVDDPARAVQMLRENYGDDVANSAVIHETTQHPLRTWLEQGDLAKPFAEQVEDIKAKAGGASNFVRIDKIDTSALEEPKPHAEEAATQQPVGNEEVTPEQAAQAHNEEGEQNAARGGIESDGNQPKYRGDDEVVGGNGPDRQSADRGPGESARGSGGGGNEQGERQEPPVEPATPTAEATTPPGQKPEYIGPRKALVDQRREALGMEPLERMAQGPILDNYDKAADILRDNPKAGEVLVENLKKSGKEPTAVEMATLAQEMAGRDAEMVAARQDYARAKESGDQDEVARASARHVAASYALNDVHELLGKAGTAKSVGMNALRAIKTSLDAERYTLPTVLQEAEIHAGRELTPKERKDFTDSWERSAAHQAVIDNVRGAATDADAMSHVQRVAQEIMREARAAKGAGKSFVDHLADRRTKALERIAKRKKEEGLHAFTFVDPRAIRDYAEIGAYHIAKGLTDFAKWSKAFLADIGEKPKAKLEDIFKAAQDLHDSQKALYGEKEPRAPKSREEVLQQAAIEAAEGKKPSGNTIEGLVRAALRDGVAHEDVMAHVTKELQGAHPGLTLRQVKEEWTRYGNAKFQNKRPVLEKELSELRQESLLDIKIEEAEHGKMPLKTGVVPDKATQRVRDLGKKLRRVMREKGLDVQESDERYLSTFQDRVKTALTNAIEDHQRYLQTGQEEARRVAPEYNADNKALLADLNDLREQKRAMDEASGKSQQERVDAAIKATERMADIYERHAAEGKKIARTSIPLPTDNAVLNAARARRQQAKSLYRDALDLDNQRRLATLQKKHDQIKRELDSQTFATKERVPKEYSARVMAATRALEYEQKFRKAAMERLRIEQIKGWDKFWYTFFRARRAVLLTSITSVEKIADYAIADGILGSIADEISSGVMSKLPVLSHLSARAQFEGGASLKAEAAAMRGIKRSFVGTKGTDVMKGTEGDVLTHLKNKHTEFDIRYEIKKGVADPGVLDYPGSMHSALKDPIVQGHYDRMVQKGMEWAMKNGVNLDPTTDEGRLNTMRIEDQAAVRAIDKKLMGDNKMVQLMSMLTNQLMGGKGAGERIAGRYIATENPILKVPTNWVATMMRREFGWAHGAMSLAYKTFTPTTKAFFGSKGNFIAAGRAMLKAIDELSPEEADIIMRRFKQGWGGGVTLLAFMSPNLVNYFGGYRTAGENRDPDDIKAQGIAGLPLHVARAIGHTGFFAQVQLGVTIRRLHDGMFAGKFTTGAPKGLATATAAAMMGLIEDVPLLKFMQNASKMAEGPGNIASHAEDLAKSMLVPGGLNNAASFFDEDVERKPENFVDALKMGVPTWMGLPKEWTRASVPEKDKAASGRMLSALRKGDENTAKAIALQHGVDPEGKEYKKLQENAALPPLVYHFGKKKLPAEADILKSAPPDKKAVLMPYFIEKYNKKKTPTPEEQQAFVRALQ